jgi:hypothetical protein
MVSTRQRAGNSLEGINSLSYNAQQLKKQPGNLPGEARAGLAGIPQPTTHGACVTLMGRSPESLQGISNQGSSSNRELSGRKMAAIIGKIPLNANP